jgi:hypothetical protein
MSLVSLDGNHALAPRHLYSGIDSVDDCHKLQEEMPPKDAVITNVEVDHFECQHLSMFIVSCPT